MCVPLPLAGSCAGVAQKHPAPQHPGYCCWCVCHPHSTDTALTLGAQKPSRQVALNHYPFHQWERRAEVVLSCSPDTVSMCVLLCAWQQVASSAGQEAGLLGPWSSLLPDTHVAPSRV